MANTLTKAEEDLLVDINRLVDFYESSDVPRDRLVLSRRQALSMKKIVNKRKKGKLFSIAGEVQIDLPKGTTATKYRGYELFRRAERPALTKRDLPDLPL